VVWLVAVAAVLTTMVLASALSTRLGDRGPDGSGAPTAPAGPVEGVEPPAPADTQLPSAGPAALGDVSWTSTCGVPLPVSQRYGPQRRDSEKVSGFARTPEGAVLAAMHLAVRTSPQAGPDMFVLTLAQQVTGPDAAAFTEQVHTGYEQLHQRSAVPYGQPLCPIYGRFAGFALDSHSDTAASLRLLIEAPGPDGLPQLASALVQLSWIDGDWRLVAPPTGDWSRVRTLLPAPAANGYTPLTPEG
jgi:hypothetical protein